MAATTFDPFRAQWRAHWHNRVARWRANVGETAFHGAALFALAGVLLWPLGRVVAGDAAGPQLQALIARWPLAMLGGVLVASLLRQRHVLGVERGLQTRHWLATQPLPPSLLQMRRRRRQWREALVHAVTAGAVLLIAGAPWTWFAAPAVAVLAAMLLAAWLPSPEHVRPAIDTRLRPARIDRGVGRLWRWQAIDLGIAFRARSLAGGFLLMLLVPMGSGPLAIGSVLACGLSLAWLLTAWRRSMAVLPAAQAWLGVQPLRAASLLRDTAAVPALVLLLACLLVMGGFLLLGTPGLGGAIALGVVTLAGLDAGSVAASRHRPRRAGLLFAVHAALLVGVLQALPMAAPLLWCAQLAWLARRALRA